MFERAVLIFFIEPLAFNRVSIFEFYFFRFFFLNYNLYIKRGSSAEIARVTRRDKLVNFRTRKSLPNSVVTHRKQFCLRVHIIVTLR